MRHYTQSHLHAAPHNLKCPGKVRLGKALSHKERR
jgi:hypothetical protein